MKRETAERMVKMQAVTCGGVGFINGKELTSKGGYFYLDDKKVDDVDAEVLAFVKVDEWYVEQLMAE